MSLSENRPLIFRSKSNKEFHLCYAVDNALLARMDVSDIEDDQMHLLQSVTKEKKANKKKKIVLVCI